MSGRFHKLRLAEAPPHPDLLHSPSQTGVNALMASGEKETAVLLGQVPGLNNKPGHDELAIRNMP